MTTADKLTRLKTDFDDVYDKGYENGKAEGDSYYDIFWDAFQQNGERTDYTNAFYGAYAWNDNSFRPKYNINVIGKGGDNMFRMCGSIDIIRRLKDCSVTFNTSNATSLGYLFYGGRITTAPIVYIPITIKSASHMFLDCRYLHTIEKIVYHSAYNIDNNFHHCSALQNITIEGEIGTDFDIKNSPLTVESAKSIITHLVNYSGTENEFAYSVTFHGDVWARLDALGNDSPNGNTWREYVNDLGWNAS